MRRVLAILGAVAMVSVAVVIRRQVDDDGTTGNGNGDDKVVIVCAKDLESYCDHLGDDVEVRLEAAADTAAALRDGTLDESVDGWVTTSAWIEVTNAAEGAARTTDLDVLAESPVAASAADGPAGDAVVDLCKGDRLWHCLGEHAGESWSSLEQSAPGSVDVGLTDADTALGLPALAAVGAGILGTLGFATNDFDPEFDSQIAALKEPSNGVDAAPLTTMVTQTGKYVLASGTRAEQKAITRPVGQAMTVDPAVTATVVLARVAHGDDLPSGDPVRQALLADGWSKASGDEVEPTLKPGVMSSLHEVWEGA